MSEKYEHQAVEKKWQERWEAAGVFSADQDQAGPKAYVLDMFPYPSADGLHVGHPEGYTATDIMARYLRMRGQRVLHPMGWDAFGLPAENAAIKKGIHPRTVTEQNVANFRRQIKSIGFSYDWPREVNTTDPHYYRWTQWIFLQLFRRGLAYEAEAPIWWCPKDKTGLANEEVVNGKCDRCGTAVERKLLKQWMLKITAYADRLLDGLEKLDWPESIKALQRNWIGRSVGANVDFTIGDETVRVFTTRPDTLFGATYIVLSPEHHLIAKITDAKHKRAVEKYAKSIAGKSDLERTSLEKEKTGVFTGAYAINPVNRQKIPVWIADYVLSGYGTGAIMAVPAHDERDFAFAKQYGLPIIPVIQPPSVIPKPPVPSAGLWGKQFDDIQSLCWTGEGTMKNSGQFDGLSSEDGREKITAWLTAQGKGQAAVNYKLRDWVFSRQRYWGEPIPLVHCEHCRGVVESTPYYIHFSDEKIWQDLLDGRKTIETRALNPEESDRYFGKITAGHSSSASYIKGIFQPTGATAYFRVKSVKTFQSLKELFADQKTLAAVAPGQKFANVQELETAYDALAPGYTDKIEKNGLIAFTVKRVMPGIILVPEKELPLELPNVEKYEPTGTGESPLAAIDDWVNVTCRVCGHPAKRETNTMPQWAGSCWYYLRYCDPHNDQAFASAAAMKTWLPVDLYVGGAEHAVLHLLYSRFWHLVLYDAGAIPPQNEQGESLEEPFRKLKNQGLILGPDGEKMSKSRGNVINPDEIIEHFGADTLRLYEMFIGPFEDAKPWDTNGIIGVRRFLERVWRGVEKVDRDQAGRSGLSHRYAAAITRGIEAFQFNTCVSDLMTWSNEWRGGAAIALGDYEVFLKLLSPFAPHLTEELWSRLDHDTMLVSETWPTFDSDQVQSDAVTIAVQVLGKLRATISLPAGSDQATVEASARAEPNVAKHLTRPPVKVVFVQDRLINFVI